MKLYKYTGLERKDVLANGLIRFTQPSQLNDPFEARPHIKAISKSPDLQEVVDDLLRDKRLEEYYQEIPDVLKIAHWSTFEAFKKWIGENRGHAEELVKRNNAFAGPGCTRQEFQERVIRFFDERFGVLCLSEDPVCFTMWSHYADSHRGFAIEFEPEHEFFHREQEDYGKVLGELMKVTYSDARPEVFWDRPDLDENEYEQYIVENFLLTKSTGWAEEKEWRMILPFRDADRKIEEDEEIYLYKFPVDAVTGAVFGLRMPEQEREKVTKLLEPYHPVEIREAVLDESTYKLEIVDSR